LEPGPRQSLMPHTFNVEIVDVCNCRCSGCPRGVYGSGSNARMDAATFGKVLSKGKSEYNLRTVALHNWAEPFLHPDLPDFVLAAKNASLRVVVSTNGAHGRYGSLEGVLANKLDLLAISVSGYSDEVHQRYHKNAEVREVREFIRRAAAWKKQFNSPTHIRMDYLVFKDNLHEINPSLDFCAELGVEFYPKFAYASGDVEDQDFCERLVAKSAYREFYAPAAIRTPGCPSAESPSFRRPPCRHVFNILTMGHTCKVYLCCFHWYLKQFEIGDFFELSFEQVLLKKYLHSACLTCRFDDNYSQLPANFPLLTAAAERCCGGKA
jgi:MoaA/NifB/PqqE/SkfB family radical SAM enzyme